MPPPGLTGPGNGVSRPCAGRTLPSLNYEAGNQPPARMKMADDKKKVGSADRARVSSTETYEIEYLAKKHNLPPLLVKKVVEQEGPMREKIEKYLRQMKK